MNFTNGRKFDITQNKDDSAHVSNKDAKNPVTVAGPASSGTPIPWSSRYT